MSLRVQISPPAPADPTTTKNERSSHDGSNLEARAKCTDDDGSDYDARTKRLTHIKSSDYEEKRKKKSGGLER